MSVIEKERVSEYRAMNECDTPEQAMGRLVMGQCL